MRNKGIFIVDCLITFFILFWGLNAFMNGEVIKGILFGLCFIIMAGVFIFRFRQKK